MFNGLEISTVIMEFFVVSFQWNLFFELPCKWEWYYSSLSERSPKTQIMYMRKLINFEIIEQTKLRGNVDDPFGLKRLFSCINIPDKFLA